ncbi:putative lipid II flippase FtsW [Paraferrimonas sedimenticola]|uniref:Probable peptidoglycan glycosyltransferase FtsW n=1 Tax=Paraferrimonas sedimenticola TaxID=375674 RepID=A0AA37RYA3_9GAMM|nr:putative lipid II flippase FtsW [Paraferrimonas sedimenticola]GLP97500.1 putative lipid II flippase FtsW [Paraferrimonas sedimenticola]
MASQEQQLALFGKVSDAAPWRWLSRPKAPTMVMYDRSLLAIILGLMAVGFVMVASASMPEATSLTGNPNHFILRHLFYLAGCVVIGLIMLQVSVEQWQKYSGYGFLLVGSMLVAVLFVGKTVNGSTRWLSLGPINIQVAELAKLAFCAYMASYLVRRHQEIRGAAWGFLKPIILLGLFSFLLLLQPDLGSSVVLFVIVIGLLFLAGARMIEFCGLLTMGVVLIITLAVTSTYRWKRVTSFLDPWENPFGEGYQLTQSLMAFGRGDWLGQGLGNSIQKLEYLPEAHTDFIFAVIGEELGFIGVIAILVLLFSLVFKALKLGSQCLANDQAFGGYLAYGIGIWFCFQTGVNVGASIGMLPTKGLTLPFISYGGSSLWVMTAAAAALIRIDFELRRSQIQATQGKR